MPKITDLYPQRDKMDFFDLDAVHESLSMMVRPGDVFELRMYEVSRKGDNWPRQLHGFFDDVDAAVKALERIHAPKSAEGPAAYVTLNPIKRDLLFRAHNRIIKTKKGNSVSDHNISARRFLLIDVDPTRESGISANDEELRAALDLAEKIANDLGGEGWPEPIAARSGNGAHLLYRIDLPNDAASATLLADALAALGDRYDNDAAKVDRAVYNAARITKLYGSMACKGSDLPSRPWRRSCIDDVGDGRQLDAALLHALAAEKVIEREGRLASSSRAARMRAEQNRRGRGALRSGGEGRVYDFESRLLPKLGEHTRKDAADGTTVYRLKKCPFSDHKDDYKAWVLRPGGNPDAWSAGCLGESCGSWNHESLRREFDPESYEAPPIPAAAETPTGASHLRVVEGGEASAGQLEEQTRQRAQRLAVADMLDRTRSDRPRPTQLNVAIILAHDPEWRGVLALDEMSGRIVTVKRPPWIEMANPSRDWEPWKIWDDSDLARMAIQLGRTYGFEPGEDKIAKAVTVTAERNARHPVREYFGSIEWDGKPRIDTWLHDFLGVEPGDKANGMPITSWIGAWWLVSAVARVMRPGVKCDYTLVLEGKQGLGKSTAIRALAVQPEWFSDSKIDFKSKEGYVALQGKWLIEFAEFDGITTKKSFEMIKGFLSKCFDDFRSPYGRYLKQHPRTCIFAATVNSSQYLKDPTGNRRYWPVKVTRVDLPGLIAARDQLWAEALARFNEGWRYWPVTGDQDALLSALQDDRKMTSYWHDKIAGWLNSRTSPVHVDEIFERCLDIPTERWDRRNKNEVCKVLREIGYERIRTSRNGRRLYLWRRTADNPPPTIPDDDQNPFLEVL